MDADAVERVARELGTTASQIHRVAHDIDRLVGSLPTIWMGHSVTVLVNQWKGSLHGRVSGCGDAVATLGRTALDNAAEQRRVSGRLEGGVPAVLDALLRGDWPGVLSGLADLPPVPAPDPDPGDLGNYEPMGDIPLDDEAIGGEKVRQGAINDCWFVAGLGSVATADPQWIRDHIRRNADGSYTVTLYEKTGDSPPAFRPNPVTVEATRVPNSARGTDNLPNFATIYEKAVAVEMGGYAKEKLAGSAGDALEIVTGRSARDDGDASLKSIRDGLAQGRIYAGGTEDAYRTWWPFDDEVSDTRIVPNHAYMIEKVEERDGQLMALVRNPWGTPSSTYHGDSKYGTVWLTERQFHDNFQSVQSVSGS